MIIEQTQYIVAEPVFIVKEPMPWDLQLVNTARRVEPITRREFVKLGAFALAGIF